LARILEQERHVPVENVQIIIILFVFVLAVNFLKGGGAFPSPVGITCGSPSFWVAHAVLLLWIIGAALYGRHILLRRHYAKVACHYVFQPGDTQWDERATTVYPILSGVAGFFAGMFGIGTFVGPMAYNVPGSQTSRHVSLNLFPVFPHIYDASVNTGGGIVKGPLMLAMGVHPAVSSATAACMILFTSFSATTSFWVFGLLVNDYAVLCFILGFVTTLVGQLCMTYVMKRAGGRNSYIAFSIGLVVLISAILMTLESLLSLAAGEHHHAAGICVKGDRAE